jgi:hypothetical protein
VGKGAKLFAIEAIHLPVHGRKPEKTVDILFDAVGEQAGQSISRRIGAPIGVTEPIFSESSFDHNHPLWTL